MLIAWQKGCLVEVTTMTEEQLRTKEISSLLPKTTALQV